MLSRRQPYHLTTTAIPGDPLLVSARLAEEVGDSPYVLYESDNTWRFAVGCAAEVVITPTGGWLRGPDGRRTVRSGPPASIIGPLLAAVPIEGWHAYGTATFESAHIGTALAAVELPDTPVIQLMVPRDEVVIRDGEATIRTLDPAAGERIAASLRRPVVPGEYRTGSVDVRTVGADAFRTAVRTAVGEIRSGRLRKVILSRVLPIDADVDVVGTYVLGRRRNTPARSFLLNLGGLRAAGFSPEIVVEVTPDGQVRAQPLAGTRELTGDASRDARLRTELLEDPKEIFEHAISVQASFAELEQLCVPGSVAIHRYMSVVERGTAQHLASELTGQLPADRGPWHAFAAVFPSVTASGIPKPEAYALIRALEEQPRDLYAGAVLMVTEDGTLDAALVLRSVYQRDGRTWLRAGAGVVEQSEPERELTETCEKLRSVSLSVAIRKPTTHHREGAAVVTLISEGDPGGLTMEEMRGDVAALLSVPVDAVDDGQNLIAQGLDSVGLMTLASKWTFRGGRVKVIDLAAQPVLADWYDLIRRRQQAQAEQSTAAP
jgi:salicylate synthase